MSWRFLAPPPAAAITPGAPPSFSVIIAAYQCAEVIGDAVSSALEQTLAPREIVVCDDGSTDDLAGALSRFGARVRLLHKPNGGAASARNAAARAATGDFVVILDADDVFLPQRLEAMAALAAERPDLDVLTTDAWLETDGRVFRRCYELGNDFVVAGQRRAIMERNFVFGLAAVRRSALLAAGGLDERIARAEDWDLWIRLVLGGSRIGLVDEPLARYRLHGGSLSADPILLVRGRCETLAKTLADPRLTAAERDAVRRSLAVQQRTLALGEARIALAEGRADARRRALRIAVGAGYGLPTRAKSLASFVAPRWAARHLERSGPLAGTGFRTAGSPAPDVGPPPQQSGR